VLTTQNTPLSAAFMQSRVYLHIVSTSSPHALHLDSKAPVCAGELVRLWGEGEMVPTGASAHAAGRQSDRGQRRPRESHTGEPGTGFVLPPPVRLAGPAGLRPGGRRCWMCGQAGRADPPATAYFYCAGCDVRWYGGTSRLRHSPEFTQGEFTWWIAGKLARIRYIDHAAEHTASPA
jgi:hypothetical protein